jgi:hypothetical protein
VGGRGAGCGAGRQLVGGRVLGDDHWDGPVLDCVC